MIRERITMWLTRRKLWIPALFLLLSSLQRAAPESATPRYDDCAPRLCGGQEVRFPFWIIDRQPSYCGPPAFALTCLNDTGALFLTVLNIKFYVLRIFYYNSSVHFTLGDANDPCAFLLGTNTSGLFPFNVSHSNKRIFFLYNCSGSESAIPRSYQNMSCPRFNTRVLFGGEYDPARTLSPDPNCTVGVVPVMGDSNISAGSNYSALLRAGWMANYTARNCSKCAASGGRCGYDANNTSTWQGSICICPNGVHLGSCSSENISAGKKNSHRILLAAVTSGSAGFLAFTFTAIFLVWRFTKSQRNSTLNRNISSSLKDSEIQDHFQTHVFSYDELVEATDCFDSSRELGDGGFGIVYKGKLRDGRTVAVKRLYGKNYKKVEQFMNEVKILSLLRHQFLVSLYGSTSHRSRELVLVYEFVPNGTVADHLHGCRAAERILTWPMRLRIAIETADALAYLHAIDPPIIHRDVKTTNILLDDGFRVKVADFGLSRLFPADATHVSTAPQGTPGYVDPEYYQCFQLTGKSDVYSFGVVLVELISSKPAIDLRREKIEVHLANMAIAKIQNHELVDLVDPELWRTSDAAARMRIAMVAELAFRCLQSDGDRRPAVNEVLEGLVAIENAACDSGDKAEDAANWLRDDASLMHNVAMCSPDTVAGKWVSPSTASCASQ
ncbi:LEAF RUST 10 DISEASE-RESISTANCE LOCUS RECEPTOR-LIKE PROTEIN KINASE-like 1.2 [Zingiber officinale]|uniref:Protein kinase domain-containing protein n=1 Tax=Zingiber officinale TaxID=94328 RepID=A0A8J5HXX0_ZINOF|nr:LEAF RUST 10 DISEASE-RESISTANCE LOCUS RECEPTOR-LIKE PROTEIN KINASE-like 1.2 [Zingiber officinale]KAG6529167.1 hypothetical protein ZIOFF_011363 [Zingiber officinale]